MTNDGRNNQMMRSCDGNGDGNGHYHDDDDDVANSDDDNCDDDDDDGSGDGDGCGIGDSDGGGAQTTIKLRYRNGGRCSWGQRRRRWRRHWQQRWGGHRQQSTEATEWRRLQLGNGWATASQSQRQG